MIDLPQNARNLCDLFDWGYPVRIPGSEMFNLYETITPVVAGMILSEFHIDYNRNKKKKKIQAYADDIASKRWKANHQGIAFNRSGLLFDGQNRLSASIESGMPLETIVTFNVDDDAASVSDTNAPRSVADVSRLNKRPLSNRTIACAKGIYLGTQNKVLSAQRTIHIVSVLHQVLAFLEEQFPSAIKGVTIQPVLSAIGRAWFHVDKSKLSRFCECLREFECRGEHERAVSTLHKFLSKSSVESAAGGAYNVSCFLKTERAILAFSKGEPITKLYSTQDELFPLPSYVKASLDS